MRWFHGPAVHTMVATPSLKAELEDHGFRDFVYWGRGVDTDLFRPMGREGCDLPGPVHVTLCRIAPEKNLEAFLDLDLPGSKLVIGGGPALESLKHKYPDARFTGRVSQEDLPRYLSWGDVFVFPSLTDTFGIVMLEANACGLPVAAFPVVGPKDVVMQGETGFVEQDLAAAIERARALSPERCRAHAMEYTWEKSLDQFESNLVPIPREELRQAG